MYKEAIIGLICNSKFTVPNTKQGREVLIINQGALGDFIHSLDLIDNLAAKYNTIPDVICNENYKSEFLQREFGFKQITPSDIHKKHYSVVIDVKTDPPLHKFLLLNNTYSLFGRKVYLKYILRKWHEPHWCSFYQDTIWDKFKMGMWSSKTAFSTKGEHIIIHPGASCDGKSWGLENYLKTIELMGNTNDLKIILGPCDGHLATPLIERGIFPIKCDTIDSLMEELSTGKMFIGNDSGVMHCASLFRMPTVGIFTYGCAYTHCPRNDDAIYYFEPAVYEAFYLRGEVKKISLTPNQLIRQVSYILMGYNKLAKNFFRVDMDD